MGKKLRARDLGTSRKVLEGWYFRPSERPRCKRKALEVIRFEKKEARVVIR